MKKKILIGTVNLDIGGIEKTLIGLLNNIDYKKYDVDLLLLKTNGVLKEKINKNVNIITPYKNKKTEKIVNSSNIICKILKHLLFNYITARLWINKNKKYDVAISYSGYYPFIDKYIGLSNSNKKLIWVHTDLKKVYETDKLYRIRIKLTKNKYNYFNKIICVSESVKESFLKIFNINNDKIDIQWNIVDINTTNNNELKIDGELKLISVGRLNYIKRYDNLIKIHQKLLQDGLNIKTYLVGSGEEELKLKNMINEYKLNDSFIMLGQLDNILNIIKQADIFVSTSEFEGWPTVLLETLHVGVPFVAPNVNGIKDIANNIAPKNSFLLKENNIESLCEGIKEMIERKKEIHFKFDIKEYNNKCIESFYELIKEEK